MRRLLFLWLLTLLLFLPAFLVYNNIRWFRNNIWLIKDVAYAEYVSQTIGVYLFEPKYALHIPQYYDPIIILWLLILTLSVYHKPLKLEVLKKMLSDKFQMIRQIFREGFTILQPILKLLDIRILLFMSLLIHLWAVTYPNNYTVMDEFYYIPSGKDLLVGEVSNLEHPFLGKIWVAFGILVFGENFFAYRIFYVLLGLTSLYILYKIALHFTSKDKAVYASIILAFEPLYFIHSSFALLEIGMITFGLLAFYLYLKKHYYLSSFSLAISILNKEIGVLFAFTILIYHLFTYRPLKLSLLGIFKTLVCFYIILLTFLGAMTYYDLNYQPQGISNGIEHTFWILSYAKQLTLDASQDLSRSNLAYSWIIPSTIPYTPMPYYIDSNKNLQWIGAGNQLLWWSIWIPFTSYFLHQWTKTQTLGSIWIIGQYFPILALTLVFNRIVYPFYYLPMLPILTLLAVDWIDQRGETLSKLLYILFFSLSIGVFLGCLPQ